MNADQFSAMLAIIVPPILDQITKNSNVDETTVISRFYQSKLYQELSDETSKLFETYGIYDYVTKYLESLHTMGDRYIVQDIDDYIASAEKQPSR